ncbi:MAG: hypothetical protein ACRCYY_01040 [Trueperaceae bacterium]
MKADRLADQPFSYRISKDDKVFINYHGKHIFTLSGNQARKFIAELDDMGETEIQLTFAKVTGNFKRGNERQISKSSSKPSSRR